MENICIHEFERNQCALCKPRESRREHVYATVGGSTVHSRPDCELLLKGQISADANGLRNYTINPVFWDKYPNRGECSWCTADSEIGRCDVLIEGTWTLGIVLATRPIGYGNKEYLVKYESNSGATKQRGYRIKEIRNLEIK